jgi:hypothetical protein
LKTTSFIGQSISLSYAFAVIKAFFAFEIKKAICLAGNSFSSKCKSSLIIHFKTESLSCSS